VDIRSLVDEWAAAMNGCDAQRMVKLFQDDLHYEDLPLNLLNRTKDELLSFLEPWYAAVPDFSVHIDQVIVDGERACVEWSWEGTQVGDLPNLPATGKRFEARGMSTFEARDGLLVKVVDCWDLLTVLKQLGYA
jgi:steroid delta-isomerase-like uncharacterized protein